MSGEHSSGDFYSGADAVSTDTGPFEPAAVAREILPLPNFMIRAGGYACSRVMERVAFIHSLLES